MAAAYFALGADADSRIEAYISDYYGFMPQMGAVVAGASPSTPDRIRDALAAYESVGVGEFLLWPRDASLDQVDRLAGAVAGGW